MSKTKKGTSSTTDTTNNVVTTDALLSATLQKIMQEAQSAMQQAASQVLQAAQETGGSLSADKKVLGTTDIDHDTDTDEAVKGKTYNDSEMWGLNKKMLVERSADFALAHQAIEIGRSRAQAAKFDTIQHVEAMLALSNGLVTHMANLGVIKKEK
jgi:hypothetical protein